MYQNEIPVIQLPVQKNISFYKSSCEDCRIRNRQVEIVDEQNQEILGSVNCRIKPTHEGIDATLTANVNTAEDFHNTSIRKNLATALGNLSGCIVNGKLYPSEYSYD